MQTTRAGIQRCAVLAAGLLATSVLGPVPEQVDNPTPKFPASNPSGATSLITSGKAILGSFHAVEDPFAELCEEDEESLLAISEDEPSSGASAAIPEMRSETVVEPEAASTVPDTSPTYQFVLGFVFFFGTITGAFISSFNKATIEKPEHGVNKAAANTHCVAAEDGFLEPLQDTQRITAYKTEVEDDYGCTFLHVAADRGSESEVLVLLEQGFSVNKREAWAEAPLHFAARAGSIEVCRLLLAHGAEVNPVSFSGCTPLLVASQTGKEHVCNFLLDHGAHVDNTPDTELPPLLNALLVERIFGEAKGAGTILDETS